jgi:sulfopyruvate decarboxylase alpha subunit
LTHHEAGQTDWQETIYRCLKTASIRQVSYVPDAGHAHVIRRVHADASMRAIVLTTEEEGVALAAGAWLGGDRSVLLMQSSGVGNCINMMSLLQSCRLPFLTLVTMRGEHAEFNPWQVPMSRATQPVLEQMGLRVLRVNQADEVEETVSAALDAVFGAGEQVAVLLSQRLIGRKRWVRD